jgi:CRP/FNR family transcriptional regulator
LESLSDNKDCGSYKKGQVIFSEGNRARGLYCINTGKVKLTKSGEEGKDQILHLAKSGDVMGYRALLSGDTFSCSAVAIEDAAVCFVPRELFFGIVEKNATLSMHLMRLLSNELKVAEQHLTDMAQKPVRERVAEALLFIKEAYGFEADGKTIAATLTREEIAGIVGTATETAIRVLTDFRQEALIETQGRKIAVLNLPKLLRVANIND